MLQARLSGHALVDVGDQYGKAFIDDLAEAINKMTFPMVDWSALRQTRQARGRLSFRALGRQAGQEPSTALQ